jgi:hypothetical protein
MSRYPNWPDLLAAFIEARRSRPFVWGAHDCCLFAADWVAMATGKDPAADLRGTYATALGAKRITDDAGGLAKLVESALVAHGFAPVTATLAMRGDLIVRDSGDGDCVGIVLGAQSAFVGADGLEFVSTFAQTDARFWKI